MRSTANQNVYFCTNCGYESRKWMGQCPACHEWNTFSEEPAASAKGSASSRNASRAVPLKPMRLAEIETLNEERYETGFAELSRVLGGGIVPGSLVLVGGDPGIGKSTILLQLALRLADDGRKVLYISGEESLRQIRLRADRIGTTEGPLSFLSETNIGAITGLLAQTLPDVCVIDSIQTMYTDTAQSAPGSVTQVRECAQALMIAAKQNNIATFLVGHVTKEGTVAGPRVLEHIVDTVLYFESGDGGAYRILRSAKNRFGSTNEIGVFEMAENGLREVPNPSEFLLSGRPTDASGAVVTCLMEGTRPMLMEVQGLVTETSFGLPRRQSSGMDYNRLNLLLAVLEKRAGYRMSRFDAYVNLTGGMRVSEPALDLAVLAAIISSCRNIVIGADTVVFGEVGLSGEVRAVSQAAERIHEAEKLGFQRIILPRYNLSHLPKTTRFTAELCGIRSITELEDIL